jgi:hypothetical protein
MHTDFRLFLVEGLVALGRSNEGLTVIEETIGAIEANGDFLHLPEALRVKGSVLLSLRPDASEAKACLAQSLDWSRRQARDHGNCARPSISPGSCFKAGNPGRPKRFWSPCSSASQNAREQPM